MKAIYKRELSFYLNAMVAYITIGIFLLSCGLLLWVFPESSILEYGYAELQAFFELTPFLFMFLVPALSMRILAEERKEGTFELLISKPIPLNQIILAKFLVLCTLVMLALIPTLIYYFSIYQLGLQKGNVDSAAVFGSYLGLCFLGAAFCSLGLFASALAKNQIIAFAIAVFLCFFFYFGLQALSEMPVLENLSGLLTYISLYAHFQSISRGVIDSRDVIYFLSFAALFLLITQTLIGRRDEK